jgi:hypothetical protein
MDFYVYVYLDPRKIGPFFYQELEFEYEPFYVGKGRNWRYKYHLLTVKRGKYSNLPKNQKIKKIIEDGFEPIIIKYSQNLEEKQSFMIEQELILKIGRKDLNSGPLNNLSNGGEGNGNRKFSEEHRKNLSLAKSGKTTENMKKHLKNLHKSMIGNQRTLGMKFTKESIEKMIKSRIKPIVKMDMQGNVLEEFSSIKEAMEKTKISMKKVLRGTAKTAGGFFWKYKSDL